MADGAELTFHKDVALPGVTLADAVYFIRTAGGFQLVVTAEDGTPVALEQPPQRLHFSFGIVGKPASGKEFGRYLAAEDLIILADVFAGVSAIAATADSDVLVALETGEPIATVHWDAGATVASIDVVQSAVAAGDVLIFTAPAPQDLTLSGLNVTIVAERGG